MEVSGTRKSSGLEVSGTRNHSGVELSGRTPSGSSVKQRVTKSSKLVTTRISTTTPSPTGLLYKSTMNGSFNPNSMAIDAVTAAARKSKVAEFENSTIVKQRHELNLMIEELKDRDSELNSMVEAHQKQLVCWEKDRRTILTMEENVSSLESEIQCKNDEIRAVTAKLRVTQSELAQCHTALNNAQEQLCCLSEQQSAQLIRMDELHKQINDLSEQQTYLQMDIKDLEDRNRHLGGGVVDLNHTIGQLEAKEQELLTVLKLKDNDLAESAKLIAELTTKLQRLEALCENCRRNEGEQRRNATDWKNKYNQCWKEYDHFKREAERSEMVMGEQKTELQKLKHESATLRKEVSLASEREKRTDQVLDLQRSKQDRTDRELQNMRELFAQQERDIAMLKLNLDSTKEVMQKQQERYLAKGFQMPVSPQRSLSPVKNRSQYSATSDDYSSPDVTRSRSPTRRTVEQKYSIMSTDHRLTSSSPSRLAQYAYSRVRTTSPDGSTLKSMSPTRLRSPERSALRMSFDTEPPNYDVYKRNPSRLSNSSYYDKSYNTSRESVGNKSYTSPDKIASCHVANFSSTRELTSAADMIVEKYNSLSTNTANDRESAQVASRTSNGSANTELPNQSCSTEVHGILSSQSTPSRSVNTAVQSQEFVTNYVSPDGCEAATVLSTVSVNSHGSATNSVSVHSVVESASGHSRESFSMHTTRTNNESQQNGGRRSLTPPSSMQNGGHRSRDPTPPSSQRGSIQNSGRNSLDNTPPLTPGPPSAHSTPKSSLRRDGNTNSNASGEQEVDSPPQSVQSSRSAIDEQDLMDMFTQVNTKISAKKTERGSPNNTPEGMRNGSADEQGDQARSGKGSNAGSRRGSKNNEHENVKLADVVD